ncbi:MAG: TRAP transporter large permease subunit [Pseudomonadota bacterium]
MLFAIWVIFYARRANFPREPKMPTAELIRVTLKAMPALVVPFIVMVGIYGGFTTVTEAATLAALAALGVSLFFYRGFAWHETLVVIADGLKSAATIMIIIATALAFGEWMTRSGVPAALVQFTLDNHMKPWEFLLAINVLLLIWAASWRSPRPCCS